MEDDEDGRDEEEHRRQRVPRPQLEQQVLARERADVAEVRHASASRAARERLDARRVVGGDEERPLPAQLRELGVEELRARLVERRVRLVEDEEPRVVEQDAAERKPLRHPARVRRDALAPHLPETEALEQHPDPLAPLGHPVQPAVEVEILERGELAVDERLVAEVAELAARRRRARSFPRSARRGRRRSAGASSCPSRSAR